MPNRLSFQWHGPEPFRFPRRCRFMPHLPDSQYLPKRPGFAARRIAADIIDNVLVRRRALDNQLDGAAAHPAVKTFERSRPRVDTAGWSPTVLRRLGTLRFVLSRLLDRGVPANSRRTETALLLGAAQNSLDGRARSRRRRSVRAPRADPARGAVCGPRQPPCCAVARARPRARRGSSKAGGRIPPWLFNRWITHLRRDVGARDRSRGIPTTTLRSTSR